MAPPRGLAKTGLRCEASQGPAAAPPRRGAPAGHRCEASADFCIGLVYKMLCSATCSIIGASSGKSGRPEASKATDLCLGGEKLVIWGVHGVHLFECLEVAKDDAESSDGLRVGMPSLSKSMTSSLSINTLRPRRRASAPMSVPPPWASGFRFDTAAKSSDEESAVEELGEVARVLEFEPWLVLTGGSRPRSTDGGDAVGADEAIVGAAIVGGIGGKHGAGALGMVENIALEAKLRQ